jgi:hypothetical protein
MPSEPVMSIQFRKTSIRSRKRTLMLAGLGLIVETIASHPKVDVARMVDVAMMSRFAVVRLMASSVGLLRTTGLHSNEDVATVPAADPDHTASNCGRIHRAES